MKRTDSIPSNSFVAEFTAREIGAYRYGFQNQEHDNELWSGAVSYKYRVEDPRLGRFFSVDPLAAKYPHNSVYAFSENMIMHAIELEGLEAIKLSDGSDLETGPSLIEKQVEIFEKSGKADEGIWVTSWADGSAGMMPINVTSFAYSPNINTKSETHKQETGKTEPESGVGVYAPKFTANLSAGAGVSGKIGGIGFTYSAASTIVAGVDENQMYLLGHNLSNDQGREITTEGSLNIPITGLKGASLIKPASASQFFQTGVAHKETKLNSRSSEAIKIQNTAYFLGYFYVEQTTDVRTGCTTEELGIFFDASIGLGMIVNFSIKQPFYKK